ncbi:MAG: phosphodiester glycosidase family protein [Anaerovoracaceae bacterium]
MKLRNRIKVFTAGMLICMMTATSVFGASTALMPKTSINGLTTQYVLIDMNNNVSPVMMTAGSNMCSADSVANMAKANGCIAAINGTYFSAYDGNPVPWGTIIKNGKILHTSNGGSVAGFTSSGKLIVDRLSFAFKGYVNGEYRSIPWRINHPSLASQEPESITVFTPEYGAAVKVAAGAKAPVVGADGKVTYIATSDFYVPVGGFAILYNPGVAYLVDDRFKVGDEVSYEVEINTTFTKPEQWKDVVQAVGAGPSLIINGQVTADGAAEGFTEAKTTTGKAARTFIGADKDEKVKIGTIASATVKEAAAVCQSLGLVNAMCLDGGGSIALYYNGSAVTSGRLVNNAMGFKAGAAVPTVKSSDINVNIDGETVSFEAYNIGGNNFFKLRDFAAAVTSTDKKFDVSWDNERKAINLVSDTPYTAVGGEFQKSDGTVKKYTSATAKIYKDGEEIKLSAYNIGGNNYFKLRDMAKAFDFGVEYDNVTKLISIDSEKSYTD